MNQIYIKDENAWELKSFKADAPTTFVFEWDYISSEWIAMIHYNCEQLQEKKLQVKIIIHDERVMDVFELVWMTSIWETTLIPNK